MTPREAELAIEALLVAAGRPVTVAEISSALPGIDVAAAVSRLGSFWNGRGMELSQGRDGISLLPSRSVAAGLAEAEGRRGRRLSEAAIATLAVIVMHQPVTIPDIERLRGIRLSRGILDSLMDSGLVRIAMRRTDAGRAAAYVSTEDFLERLGLGSLGDLPTAEEIDEILGEAPAD